MTDFVKQNKGYLAYGFFFTLLAHLIKFVNYYPCWDSILGVKQTWSGMISFGRWFAGPAEIILSSKYDLQWVVGVEAAIFISITAVLVLELFGVEDKFLRLVSISLFAVFPSFAATFMYGLWTPAYMLGLFFAALSVYLCVKRPGIGVMVAACVMMTLSLAIYQIYFLFGAVMVAYYIAKELMAGDFDIKSIKKIIVRFVILTVASFAGYAIIGKVLRTVGGYGLSDYQGISTAGRMSVGDIVSGIKKMINSTGSFFLGAKYVTFYGILNVVILILLAVLLISVVWTDKENTVLRKIIVTVLYGSVIPITYVFYLASPGVIYHRLMQLSLYFVYFLGVLLICKDCGKYLKKRVPMALMGLICLLTFYHFINDNTAYHQASISYEKSYFEITELMGKIDAVNTQGTKKLCIIGGFNFGEDNYIVTVPNITGAETDNMFHYPEHIFAFAKYYMDRDYVPCSAGDRAKVLEAIDIDKMSAFPYGECVTVVDDIIVVKLPARTQ